MKLFNNNDLPLKLQVGEVDELTILNVLFTIFVCFFTYAFAVFATMFYTVFPQHLILLVPMILLALFI